MLGIHITVAVSWQRASQLDAQQLPEYPGLAHAVLSSVVPVPK